jgi:hypothetical protein
MCLWEKKERADVAKMERKENVLLWCEGGEGARKRRVMDE